LLFCLLTMLIDLCRTCHCCIRMHKTSKDHTELHCLLQLHHDSATQVFLGFHVRLVVGELESLLSCLLMMASSAIPSQRFNAFSGAHM